MARLLYCKAGSLPFNFLGLPIGANMKKAKHWKPIVDKFNSKLSNWKANNLSLAGRVVLAKAVLGALPNYYLSIFKAPKKVVETLEKIRRSFIWGTNGRRGKIRWIAWEKMTKPKQVGGLGIGDIRELNMALLVKWWWKLKEYPYSIWANVIMAIHGKKKSTNEYPLNKGYAGLWKDIRGVEKDLLVQGINIKKRLVGEVGEGNKIKFWNDNWFTSGPIRESFPKIYALAKNKEAWVKECMKKVGGTIQWGCKWIRDPLDTPEWEEVSTLMGILNTYKFREGEDHWMWQGRNREEFNVAAIRRIIYEGEIDQGGEYWAWWNNWVPPKVNLFGWWAYLDWLPTKLGLSIRGVGLPDVICIRCREEEETMDHLLVRCMAAKVVWDQVYVWLKIPFQSSVMTIKEMMKNVDELKGSEKWKKVIKAIVLTTMWEIWKERNEKTFSNHFITCERMVDLIKELSFLWIKCRSGFGNIDWGRWCDFNVRDVIM